MKADNPLLLLLQQRQFARQPVKHCKYPLQLLPEILPGWCQPDAPPLLIKQPDLQLLLQLFHRFGQCRL